MTDIAELFNRDPLELTKTDIQEIIKYMRENRAKFALEGAKAKEPKPKVDMKKKLSQSGLLFTAIDLADLGL